MQANVCFLDLGKNDLVVLLVRNIQLETIFSQLCEKCYPENNFSHENNALDYSTMIMDGS